MADPFALGAIQRISRRVPCTASPTERGASGTLAGVTTSVGVEAEPVAMAFVAVTTKVRVAPSESPPIPHDGRSPVLSSTRTVQLRVASWGEVTV